MSNSPEQAAAGRSLVTDSTKLAEAMIFNPPSDIQEVERLLHLLRSFDVRGPVINAAGNQTFGIVKASLGRSALSQKKTFDDIAYFTIPSAFEDITTINGEPVERTERVSEHFVDS